jgi:hypothetical protein
MEPVTSQVAVEPDRDTLPPTEFVDLLTQELERVSGGICDPGLIVHEK